MITSGALRVGIPDELTPLAVHINITKNGYLYVFLSNESPTDVYFDDLVVKHTTGHLLQEDTYYPYGLGIRSLSSKALNRLENKYLFNGIEKLTEFDLEIYDARYRNLDPQTGRWWQRDPMTEKYFAQSPYHVSGNNPINHSDPLGDDYFLGIRGNIIWQNSTARSTVISGELFVNVGTTVVFDQNGLFELHINGSLAYVGYSTPALLKVPGLPHFLEYTEHATPYHKGQEPFVLFIEMVGKNGLLPQFRKDIYDKNLKHEAAYARDLYGGVNPQVEDKIRIKSDLELIPTLRAAYAQTYPGRDENLTILTNEEAKKVLTSTTAELALVWVPEIAALRLLRAGSRSPAGGLIMQHADDIGIPTANRAARFVPEKSIVIGEGMLDRVKPTAKSIGAKWYQAWSKNFPGRKLTEAELNAAKVRNARWLNSKIDEGYKIYDIGPRGVDIKSPFYQLERDIIQKRGYPTTPLPGF
jgi:RHS repeat-associated protein